MTKRACILVAAALWLAACGNSQTATDMAASDGGAADQGVADLAGGPDLSALLGCKGLVACQTACNGDRTCSMNCRTQATMQAGTLSRALSGCQRQACDAPFSSDGGVDAGAFPCMRGAPPSAECTACLSDSTESAGSCMHPADSACGACVNQFNACQADLP